jgi:hypothetical protein
MREGCYNCGEPATTSEHAPPDCFFPDRYRTGLLRVPSCHVHNTSLSKDVEYVRNVISGQRDLNLVASRVFETAKQSFDHSTPLFNRTFSDVHTISVDGDETGAFRIELKRFNKIMRAIAFAMYYHDFGQRNTGDFEVFSTSLNSESNLYYGAPDGYENMRNNLEVTVFRSKPVPQPKVFKYGISRQGRIQYKFEFYEGFVVYAGRLPYRLSSTIYLPVTQDYSVFRRGRE